MNLGYGCPVPGGGSLSKDPADGLGQSAFENSGRAPEIGGARTEREPLWLPVPPCQRPEPFPIRRFLQERDEMAGRIFGHSGQCILAQDGGEVGGGENRDPGRYPERRGHRLLDSTRHLARIAAPGSKDDVAAVEKGTGVGVAQTFHQCAEIRHRDPLGSPHIDPAYERYMPAGHALN